MIAPVVFIVAGLVLPYITAFLNKEKWSDQTKFIISMAVSVIAVVSGMWIGGSLTSVAAVIKNASVVWATAQIFYQTYFKNSAINTKLLKIGIKN